MIKRLLLLNGMAIIGAVIYHATGWVHTAMFFWTDRYRTVSVPNFDALGSSSYYVIRAAEQLLIFCVPAFLFISGYFISVAAGRTVKNVTWKIIFARVKDLLIPFLIWSVLILIFRVFQGERFGIVETISIIMTGRATLAYYFIPVLISLYLVSPLLVPLARRHWIVLLIISAIIQVFAMVLIYFVLLSLRPPALVPFFFLTRSWLFTGYLFWFSLGMVIGFHIDRFKSFLAKTRWIFLTGWILTFFLGMIEWEQILKLSDKDWIGPQQTLLDSVYILSFLMTFLAFDRVPIPFSTQIGQIGTKSYGIYLLHMPVLEVSSRLTYHFFPGLLGFPIPFGILLTIAGLAIPLVVMKVVDRSPARRYYKYLFG